MMPGGSAADRTTVVGAVAAEPRSDGASDLWSQLVRARTSEDLCEAWLGILCQWIPGTQAGLLLLSEHADHFVPAAVWPHPRCDLSYLAGSAQRALGERVAVIETESSGMAKCAYPLLGAELTYGAVVLHVVARGGDAVRDAMRLLHWGAGWLVGLFDKRDLIARERQLAHSALLQDLVLGAIAEQGEAAAVRWIVNRIAVGLPCRHAILGRVSGSTRTDLTVVGVSGSAEFDARTNLASAAREAMTAVLDTGQAVDFPPADQDGLPGMATAGALAEYSRGAQAGGALAIPLFHGGQTTGVLLLDSDTPFDAETRALALTLAAVLAPCIAIQTLAARRLFVHLRAALSDTLAGLTSPRHAAWKLCGALMLLLFIATALVDTSFRVRAPATVEGEVQRVAAAPFEGYVAEAPLRAGDAVHAGDVLARMDDRDLKLEEGKAAAARELADRKLREALGGADAVAVRIAEADLQEQAAALELVQEKLRRALIVAPFDGRIVKGDLSQQLGAPVEQGQILFEVAPQGAWRVVLKVDERDVSEMREGESGELVLAGLPGEHFVLRVRKVSPVAQAQDGRNSFRVEAQLLGAGAHIQPGMQGVGKVSTSRHSLLWISLHRLIGWLWYTAWTLGL